MVSKQEAEKGTEQAAATALVTGGMVLATTSTEMGSRILGGVLAIAGIGLYYVRELRKRGDDRYTNGKNGGGA